MRTRLLQLIFLGFGMLMLTACSKYEKLLKSSDINKKLTMANECYDKKQYNRANELYQGILPMVKGTRNFEPMYYRYAWSYYNMKDYLSASYHFKNFVDFFPTSKDAEECQYMQAVSLYKMSPKFSLEQTNTVKAVEAMQAYINMYPASKRLSEASKYIDEARQKLERKEADAARLYYNISQYKAAAVAYKSVLRNYPESDGADYYQFMIVKSNYYYARQSVEDKQEERYATTISSFNDFKEEYPNSKYLRDAEVMHARAESGLKKIRK
jgi:outer membrane protein assembly factor BamD